MTHAGRKLLRIGVFYDGGFFYHVSNYYRYAHPRKQRISIPGLHEFIRRHVAGLEEIDERYSQIVDAHFFRGRLSAQQVQAHGRLYAERAFNDVLMNEGVTTHYLPIPGKTEKGIDVWLSLEAFELTMYKQYDVLVLIAGDSDFLPLVRKVNSLGTRVMVLGWHFRYTDDLGRERTTATSVKLRNEVTYPVAMHDLIDEADHRGDPLIDGLFVEFRPPREPDEETEAPRNGKTADPETSAKTCPREAREKGMQAGEEAEEMDGDATGEMVRYTGSVLSLKEGFGFIESAAHPNNVFFHYSSLLNRDFADLEIGDRVRFTVIEGPRGPAAKTVETLDNDGEEEISGNVLEEEA